MATNEVQHEEGTGRTLNRHGETMVNFLVRLPEELYDAMSSHAHDNRKTKADVVREALRRHVG